MSATTTRVFQIDPDQPDLNVIALAAEVLLAGGLVAFPTETVYGLGANGFDEEAVARIFVAKQRPLSDPIILHISSLAQLPDVAADIPALVYGLAEQFWPGPLTLVLKRGSKIPANVSAGLPTVAVRMPSHKIALALLDQARVPVAAPSANLFSRPSATTWHHVFQDLGGRIALILGWRLFAHWLRIHGRGSDQRPPPFFCAQAACHWRTSSNRSPPCKSSKVMCRSTSRKRHLPHPVCC